MNKVSFESVSYVRKGQRLLDHIDWTIAPTQHWALIGLNGAGKTLLLQLVTGFLWPSEGKLTVLGETFGQTSIPELAKRIGWMSSALTDRMVNDSTERIVLSGKHASFGLYQKIRPADLLEAKNILHSLHADSLIGKEYRVLSQGEKQVVLLARALMARPELLILDEPCTGLDLFAREKFLRHISHLLNHPNAPTIIFVTHHSEEILPEITHVLMLKEGKVFAQGPKQSLLTKDTFQSFYEHPVRLYPIDQNRTMVLPEDSSY